MSGHQCPRCALIFASNNELRGHFRQEHDTSGHADLSQERIEARAKADRERRRLGRTNFRAG